MAKKRTTRRKSNPRGRHLAGATAKQQRQYEDIKKAERARGVPLKDAKRIAAATVRKLAKRNPNSTGRSAIEWSRLMSDLRDVKPRPIKKLFGSRGPTPEQKAQYDARVREWNRQYRHASKMQKIALIEDNEEFRRQRALQNPRKRRRNKAGSISEADIAKLPASAQAAIRKQLGKVEEKESKASTPTQKKAATKARRSFLARLGTRLRVIGSTKKIKVSARDLKRCPRKTIKVRARHDTDAIAKAREKLGGGYDELRVTNPARRRKKAVKNWGKPRKMTMPPILPRGTRVRFKEGYEHGGKTGVIKDTLPVHTWRPASTRHWTYIIQLDGFPIRGGWHGQVSAEDNRFDVINPARRRRRNPYRSHSHMIPALNAAIARAMKKGLDSRDVMVKFPKGVESIEQMSEAQAKTFIARLAKARPKSNPRRRRNAEHKDSDHPIEVHKHYRAGPPGYLTPWQRAHHAGQKQLFETGIRPAKKRNAAKKRKRNPSPAEIRKEFAGSVSGARQLFFPEGSPHGMAKLGKLVSITTEEGTIKPVSGTAWLCSDTKGHLHLGSVSGAPLYDGPRRDFGEVTRIEYEDMKKHLGYSKPTIFFHHTGTEDGIRPTLHADGKGGLIFRGGHYRITSRGLEN